MQEYHKIQTLFKRDEKTKRIIEAEFTCPEFGYLAGNAWAWSEKVDGTNIRIGYNGLVKIGGRTDNASIPATLVAVLHERFKTPEGRARLATVFGENPESEVTLYGEGYGAKIQSGGNYIRDGVDFVLFDVRIGTWWLERSNVEDIAEKLGIEVVPIIAHGTLREAIELVRGGFQSPKWPLAKAEGLVLRPAVEIFNRRGDRIITKLKTRDFR